MVFQYGNWEMYSPLIHSDILLIIPLRKYNFFFFYDSKEKGERYSMYFSPKILPIPLSSFIFLLKAEEKG